MYYEQNSSSTLASADGKKIVVDLRSDTLTKPTKTMKDAMYNAELGDDVYGEDPTVNLLEKKAAQLIGKEAAIFVSSGTMGNLIAIMNHCDVRGSEAYCGDSSHTLLHEQCGAAQIAGVNLRPLQNKPDGSFDLKELESKLRKDREHEPISKLVLVENTINGKIVPQAWMKELVKFCKNNELKLHMDGARLWNAAVGSSSTAKDLVAGFDSVTFCLSKGLGAPAGSMLCGSKEFVSKARRVRKALGGGMRQVGVLAAAGLVAIEDTIPILHKDHEKALKLATAINELGSKVFRVDLGTVQTNMVFVQIDSELVPSTKFAARLREIQDENEEDKVIVKCLALNDFMVRFVLYYDVTDDQLQLAIRKVAHVMKKFDAAL